MQPPRQVLLVCAANVCRSPMGEALLRDGLQRVGVDIAVSSAGVRADGHGLPVDPIAVQLLAERSLDISRHEPRQITRAHVDGADMVVTMTRQDLRQVAVLAPGSFHKIFTWKQLARRSVPGRIGSTWDDWLETLNEGRAVRDLLADDPDDDVADPYGQSVTAHALCLEELTWLTRQLVLAVRSLDGCT